MCEYCKNLETGNDFKPLIDDYEDLNNLGEARIYVAMQRYNGLPFMVLGIDANSHNPEYRERINYCPKCGRELKYEWS